MEHITVGRKYNEGKVAFVECIKNGSLDNINIEKSFSGVIDKISLFLEFFNI